MCSKKIKKHAVNFDRILDKDKHYIAGFLDGDGCILCCIEKAERCKYKHNIRVQIVFVQTTKRHWFLIELKELLLGAGHLVKRKGGLSVLCISDNGSVRNFLVAFQPFIRMKRSLTTLVLRILDKREKVQSQLDFLEVCHLVDKTADLTDSIGRKNSAASVKKVLEELKFSSSYPSRSLVDSVETTK